MKTKGVLQMFVPTNLTKKCWEDFNENASASYEVSEAQKALLLLPRTQNWMVHRNDHPHKIPYWLPIFVGQYPHFCTPVVNVS
jgi:hypothetical protein